MFEDPRGIAT
jgi:hypothetical protein